MTTFLTVTPAYGRDYKSVRAAKEDWMNGKDFILSTTGQYINRDDILKDELVKKPAEVMIRYKKLTMINKLETFK